MKINFLWITLFLLLTHTVSAADYRITDFGAVRGSYSTPAIQAAIDAAAEAGGGRVVVPAGKFITGTIVLKSHVELYLEPGS